MKSLTSRRIGRAQFPFGGWIMLASLLASCSATQQVQQRTSIPTLGERDAPGMHISLVWEAFDNSGKTGSREFYRDPILTVADPAGSFDRFWGSNNWPEEPLVHLQSIAGRTVEIEGDYSLDGFDQALSRATSEAGHGAGVPRLGQVGVECWRSWQRACSFDSSSKIDTVPWRWHAAVLARPEDFKAIEQVFSKYAQDQRYKNASASTVPGAPGADVLLIESSASLPSELRWISPAERAPDAGVADRARWRVRAAMLARQVAGWTYIPASVDSWGRREPGYLYASGDVASVQRSLGALRAAFVAPLQREALLLARQQQITFARAQLQQERFRLHAMHGSELPRFEADLAALEQLKDDELETQLSPQDSRWSAVGPTQVWRTQLADLGKSESPRAPMELIVDPKAEADLARMWAALGGPERWRAMKTLRALGTIEQAGGNSRQGVEQWIDFESDRFALAQIVSASETLVAATAAEAWSVDQASGVDLTPSQAFKLRARQERTLFSVLWHLAQPEHKGLVVLKVDKRLVILSSARELCWLELGDDGLPQRLGYKLDDTANESLYEFRDWKLDGRLPYPVHTQQVDRNATVELQFVDAGAELDQHLWLRGKR